MPFCVQTVRHEVMVIRKVRSETTETPYLRSCLRRVVVKITIYGHEITLWRTLWRTVSEVDVVV